MKDNKQQTLEMRRKWLIDNDVHFVEFANGHVRVFDAEGEAYLDCWLTTARFKVGKRVGYEQSWAALREAILKAYGKIEKTHQLSDPELNSIDNPPNKPLAITDADLPWD